MSKEKGTVRWFDPRRGFGFLHRDSGNDLFVHQSAILMDGYRTLNEGQAVEFEVIQGKRGLEAANVVPL